VLAPDQSAALRDRLLGELDRVKSTDEAAVWAQRSMPAKNTLTNTDIQLVVGGFRARLALFGERWPDDGQEEADHSPPGPQASDSSPTGEEPPPSVAEDADAGRPRLAAKTIRLRDKEHRKFVSTQPCVVCGRTPADPHHLRFAQPHALGRKTSDEFTVPLCRLHHNELHRYGDEVSWWAGVNVDPVPIALKLWRRTRAGGAPGPAPEGAKPQAARADSSADGARRDQDGGEIQA
jgi:hypothetical protein